MMTCQEISALATAFEDGTLKMSTWVEFKMHLLLCPPCMEYVRQLRVTSQVLGELPPEDLPDGLRHDLAEHFRAWHDKNKP